MQPRKRAKAPRAEASDSSEDDDEEGEGSGQDFRHLQLKEDHAQRCGRDLLPRVSE